MHALSSQVQHHTAMHCTDQYEWSQTWCCKYSYPMYWVSEHKSFDVCLQAADSKILVQLAIAIAW